MELLQEGLQERAVRIQELEMTVARLEAEWPDTATLQAAIESDKVPIYFQEHKTDYHLSKID